MKSSVGEILREARENQGRALTEVAEELCLTPSYLQAIEADDVESLPGTFFYKSFVKQYAEYLGVDQSTLQSALQQAMLRLEPAPPAGVAGLDPAVESTNRYFVPDRAIGWPVAALAGVLLLCTGFYAWWTRTTPLRAAKPASTVASVLAQPNGQVHLAPAAATSVTPTSAASVSVLPNPTGGVLLSLSATEETWLSITSGGKEIFSGILRPSESKTVAGSDTATMRIGNAGGVEVRLNGKPIPQLGPRGQVLTVHFTPQDFRIMPVEEPL